MATPLTPPSPREPDRTRVRELLAADPLMVRAHGLDAEASVVRALTSGSDAGQVRDQLTVSRADTLTHARADLLALTTDPHASAEVVQAATERGHEIEQVLSLANLNLTAATMLDAVNPVTVDTDTLMVRSTATESGIALVVSTIDRPRRLPDEQVPAELMRTRRPQINAVVAVSCLALMAVLWVLTPMVDNGLVRMLLALVTWVVLPGAALFNVPRALPAIRWSRGRASDMERAWVQAEHALAVEQNRTDVFVFDGRGLDVLHAFTPEHPVWTLPHPGVPDANGRVMPVFARLMRITTDDPTRRGWKQDQLASWLMSAGQLLNTYVDDPDYDLATATDRERDAMTTIAAQLFQVTRDPSGEDAAVSRSVQREQARQQAIGRRADLLDAYTSPAEQDRED